MFVDLRESGKECFLQLVTWKGDLQRAGTGRESGGLGPFTAMTCRDLVELLLEFYHYL